MDLTKNVQLLELALKLDITFDPKQQLFRVGSLRINKTKSAKGMLTFLEQQGLNAFDSINLMWLVCTHYRKTIQIKKRLRTRWNPATMRYEPKKET